MPDRNRYLLEESRMPRQWYNIVADLPAPPAPPLHPGTGQPIGPDDLAPLFPKAIIAQEVSTERWIDIPEPVCEVFRMWRPSPLFRARRLEKLLGTPAKIYFKYEGVSPAGSHKPNSAVPQAWYNAQEGVKKLSTETGAGQWGSSLAFAGGLFGLDVTVYQVRVSYDQKPYRRAMMETWGAKCLPSPSDTTEAGRAALAKNPDFMGSLGLAISEAVEVAAKNEDTKYALGSVLNHVLLHQTIVGQEAILQMEMTGDDPDVIVGCTGGGSNFAGIAFPFIGQQLRGEHGKRRFVAVEPAACPSLTRGKFAYDFGDTSHLTPLVNMHTLGSTFTPPGFHAGGLRYHGMAPMISHVAELGLIEAQAYHQKACFEAGVMFARTEGIVPAPEATHAIKGAIEEALRCKREGKAETILFCLSGHGHLDMAAYQAYFDGKLIDQDYDEKELAMALSLLPQVA
ncbi:MAG: TrpB-like pyridoxal phosphate-dependent enzyme [Candidatus Dactylopiibacterium carminicum]|uniref:Tryptophan synthase beta chain n=1 Tax=Candidatus Dactylopiibacterium carminicum TaxID=857335 RepID=A0A272ETP6_9RHOO|nr:TrpB-like pyridoxal phosphate-dependent enzyme [Candidatus Dactylopiibacterium carminicum]KAF7599109.1 TrpB-like pyridoxal phosphate-dependent enzyme [Candidatus Dactylopiibacterium carminicum]PAS93130.1 MAG: TrpB-like pyridoxal phosphate-dependent enzyme [Candidatus Dactylopiibacterium carminicum]PAS96898.1 MAG: TrpB-like pyridoxal phosphate-dependent enzyme [Candidatus Dactylopiibacterium carminicum]PAS99122.1 MAG: TrpB-like pyridoxal-phosphate dependent enzyme [Candidatus Dactylopiibacter